MTGFESGTPTPNQKGVWYKHYISECPVCGRGSDERTRMPPPRPDNLEDRYEWEQVYDWCDAL